jgi:putative spermidine/putrescine transport system ATP-binding protein
VTDVRVENLSKTYGSIVALRNVNLEVHSGEYLAIVGPSGCGKTTLIKSIAGIVQPDEGEVFIDDRRVTGLRVDEKEIGYVFQEIALFPHMTVIDNISYGLMVKGVPPRERRSPINEMLELMSLADRRSSYPEGLSGGARQKTAVARALASGSGLLLLDEPLGALDLKVRGVLRYELRSIVKDLGLTAIHVTHDQEEALSISDRIVIMKAGRVVEVGRPEDLYLQPRNLFTAKFLGEANFMEGVVSRISERGYIVDVDGSSFDVDRDEGLNFLKGEACILMIRPEFVDLDLKNEPGGRNLLKGEMKTGVFVGDSMRYDVEVEDGLTILAKYPLSHYSPEIRADDEVFMYMPRERIRIYRYPEEGLEKELSLE